MPKSKQQNHYDEDLIIFIKNRPKDKLVENLNIPFDNKTNYLKSLYELAITISDELNDNENKNRFKTRLKLLNEKSRNDIINNIKLTIKSIIQVIQYEIFELIKKSINIINILINIKEIEIAKKFLKRQYAQLNFYLIQYIRKMRILKQELIKFIPSLFIEEIFNYWEIKRKLFKDYIEKFKIEMEKRF